MTFFWTTPNTAETWLRGGEIHYFRLDPKDWRNRLLAFQDSGGRCVCTYTPWLIHEPRRNQYDFTGRLDLERFASLCDELGLSLIARPGPYSYSELIYAGLPGWLCEDHPELRARRSDGSPHGRHVLSYSHPTFLEHVRTWYAEVLRRLRPFSREHGGPLIALQLDNETMGLHAWNGGWDFSPEAMGIGTDGGPWPDFLLRRYGTLAAAAEAHGFDTSQGSDLAPLDRPTAGSRVERRRVKDYQDFYLEGVARFFRQLAAMVEQAGIDLPLITNAANPNMNFFFEPVLEALEGRLFLGSDHYYMLGQDWPQNHPTPQWAVKIMVSLEALVGMGQPALVLEMPGGSASDFPPFLGRDALCAYMTHLAFGLEGWDYYIFVDGVNVEDTGETGAAYVYGAAVDVAGERTRVFAAQQTFHRFLDQNPWLIHAEPIADCRVGVVPEYARSESYARDSAGLIHPNEAAWHFMHRGVLTSALCGNVSPVTTNLSRETITDKTDLPLIVPTADTMAAPIQQALLDFLDAGGSLLLTPMVPYLDEQFRPCTILMDALNARSETRLADRHPGMRAIDIGLIHASGPLVEQVPPPGAEVVAVTARGPCRTLGWHHDRPGGGQVGVLGLAWSHAQRHHASLLETSLARLGWVPRLASNQPDVWLRARCDGQRCAVFAMNFHSETSPVDVSIRTDAGTNPSWIDLPSVRVPPMSVAVHDGSAWQVLDEDLSYRAG